MPSFDEIAQLVREQTGFRGPLAVSTTLQGDLGVYGDDMYALLKAYAERFGVDLSEYRWYFHTGEEGFNLGGLFVAPPNRRVQAIPITLAMLQEFANGGAWSVSYPPHEEPGFRGDILINQVFFAGSVVFLVAYFIGWLVK
jgi:hypothetical protein